MCRQILQQAHQPVPPTSGVSGSAAPQRGGRRQPGRPQRTWHDGQRTAESSSSGLGNTRGSIANPRRVYRCSGRPRNRRLRSSLCILQAPKRPLRSGREESCRIPSFPGSPRFEHPSVFYKRQLTQILTQSCEQSPRVADGEAEPERGGVAGSVPRGVGGQSRARGSRLHRPPVTLSASLGGEAAWKGTPTRGHQGATPARCRHARARATRTPSPAVPPVLPSPR